MKELKISTERHTQLLDITSEVRGALDGASGAAALVYVPHTTAGLTINEHADPLVARDFEMALEKIVPEGWGWQHLEEGEENAPSHPRASLMGPQVVVPLRDDGELALGTWQGIFLCEFDGPRTRSVYVSVLQQLSIPTDGGDEVLFFVGVEDVAATLARAEGLGGTVVQPIQHVPGVSFGVFEDAQGHRVGVAANG